MNKPIFLYGAPASGKTTLGKRLAAALNAEFVDLDHKIVEVAGCPIPQIFAEKGEPYFRDLESKVLADVANSVPPPVSGAAGKSTPPRIISLGGGTLLRDANRAIAEAAGTVFCLDTPSDEELARRIGSEAGSRPLGNKARERAPHYNSFPNRVAASFDLDNSLVIVGKGLAPAILAGERVVADENVEKLYGGLGDAAPEAGGGTSSVPRAALGRGAVTATIPSGEEHKTIETVASLWKAFAAAGVGRKDRVVAVGGGVTGDLTGFAAATWMRGISWINVPTTLLSMVDASTGGKTGCDLPEGKNLAGAFHAPRLVVIDTDFLKTLPPEILRQGKAEMIKHEAIGGVPYREPPSAAALPSGLSGVAPETGTAEGRGTASIPTPSEIAENLAVKVGVVREDPFETKGKRIFLNCGHTIGHAVEKLSNYTLAHGEAVAIGCVEEARLAVKLGLADEKWVAEFAARFAEAGLPTELPEGTTWEKMVPVMKGDKKRAGDVVTFTLPCGWGDVRAVPIDLGAKEVEVGG